MAKVKNTLAGEKKAEPSGARRVLARRSTSEWGVGGIKKCSVELKDVVKQEPMTFVQINKCKVEREEMMEEIGYGEEGQGEDEVDAVDAEEVTVMLMEIPNFQIHQATSLQVGDLNKARRDEKGRVSRVEGGNFLDSAKIAKRKIEQKKSFLAEMKLKEEMKRAKLQDMKAEDLEDKIRSSELAKTGAELQKREEELKKRKAELERTVNAVVKEKCEIAERLKKRDAKAADLKAEIEAAERLKMVKEEELRKNEAEVQEALLLLQAAAPAK